MNEDMIRQQSKAAYGQWCVQWRDHAKQNSKFEMKSLRNLENTGIGKAIVCVANGYSFEENIETLKKNRKNVDIMACDKTLGHLIDHGIRPDYVLICDANVDYERYLKPWENQLQDSIAIMNVCGNPKWADNGNWKDKYFFINKDILQSELEFSSISGCKNFIPAGTNVSNAMVVMLTQSDNEGRRNYFGYDKILLIGYDYSWRHGGKYYAFNDCGDNKEQYMKHVYCVTQGGSFAYTSGNLAFSAQWMETYIKTFGLPVIQCSKETILGSVKFGKLEDHIGYRFKEHDSVVVRLAVDGLRDIELKRKELQKILIGVEREHKLAFLSTV